MLAAERRLAEALVKRMPAHLNAVFFCNSGAEAMEGAHQVCPGATGRAGLVSLEGAFHGLSMGRSRSWGTLISRTDSGLTWRIAIGFASAI